MKDHLIRNWILGLAVFVGAAVVLYLFLGPGRRIGSQDVPGSAGVTGNLVDSSVRLYFSDRETGLLKTEERNMRHPETTLEFGRMILGALLIGPEKNGERTLPSETLLRAFYVLRDGTAVVDFSKEVATRHPGGAMSEYATVMSVVHSLATNIPDIKRVRFLVDGKEKETLAGHIDLGEPFSPDPSWVR